MLWMLILFSLGLAVAAFSGFGGSSDSDDPPLPDDEPDSTILEGTNGDDTLVGTERDDLIFGYRGNDLIYGDDGNDVLVGGAGDDTLHGGEGGDLMIGGHGDDLLLGGQGDDLLVGGPGNDTLHGDDGDDLLFGVSGSNELYGGAGDDIIVGLDARGPLPDDAILRPDVGDVLRVNFPDITDAQIGRILAGVTSVGAPGADILDGGPGNDFILGDSGDTMTGGEGFDEFAVLYDGAAGFVPVTITDYVPMVDQIQIQVTQDVVRGPLQFDPTETGSTTVSMNDIALLELQGVTPSEAMRSTIRLVNATGF